MREKQIETREGVIEEALPSTTFRVRFEDGTTTLGHLSGKMRIHYIRIVPGDRVLVELSPDRARGRITRRL